MPKKTLPLLLLTLVLFSPVCAQDSKITTYPVPDAVGDSPYSLSVDGVPLPMEKAGEHLGAYFARIELRPNAMVRARVAVNFSVPTTFTLKPEKFRKGLSRITGTSTEFDIDSPGPRVITTISGTRELWPLIILVDPMRQPEPEKGKVYRISDYVSGTGLQTKGIQKALDECGSNGGGTVLFPPGVFTTGSIFVRDNTTLLLSPGTLVKGSSDPSDFPEKKDRDSDAPGANRCALINFDGAKNSNLCGPGVIDGNGLVLRNRHGKHIRTLLVLKSESIRIEDVVLRDSPSWTFHIFGSKSVHVDRLKVLADWSIGNTDGIDVDCSQDVSISNYFDFNGDDGLAIKTTTPFAPSKDIAMKDSVVMTHKSGFKIGTETLRDISHVLIENCEAINTGRGIGLHMRDGGTISDVTYRNIKLDIKEYPNETYGGSPFSAGVSKRAGIGKIDGVTLENVQSSAPWYSDFTGMPESSISNVTFKNCSFEITDRTVKTDKLPVFNLKYCRGFAWENCRLIWKTPMLCLWDGVLKTENCEKVQSGGLTTVQE